MSELDLTLKQISQFKRANKKSKERLAKEWGTTIEKIVAKYYDIKNPSCLKKDKEEVVSTEEDTTTIPNIKIVNILDNSGSMRGDKFNNAHAGVVEEVKVLKKDLNTNYTYSLFVFDGADSELLIANEKIANVNIPPMGTYNGTPLYLTIVQLYKHIVDTQRKDEKVLVKIFTDGRDEHSARYYEEAIAAIKSMTSIGVTVTFVGTEEDVAFIVNKLGVDESNTLVHDNTGKGVLDAFDITMNATMSYSKKVANGEDVSRGFYINFK